MSMTSNLVDELRKHKIMLETSRTDSERVAYVAKLLGKAADTIEELPAKVARQNGGGWISCADRMPEEYDSMFVKFKGTEKWIVGMYEKVSDDVNVTVEYENGARKVKTLHTCDGKWKVENSLLKFKVIAWQPLPPVYKKAGD